MDKPLSFSAYKDYMQCPRYYKFKRIDKLPAGRDTSALVVGTIIDDAVMALLQGNEFNLDDAIVEASTRDLEYYGDDIDWDLIGVKWATGQAQAAGWRGKDVKKAVNSFIAEQDNLSLKQSELLRILAWKSLTKKIKLMYHSFEKWIYPQIDKVHDVQLHLNNGTIHGYLDFTATMKDGKRVLFDLKTSKKSYDADAAKTAPQLALYAALHGYDYVGFIVLSKSINKNKDKSCKCGYSVRGGNRTKCPDCGAALKIEMNPASYSQMLIEPVSKWHKELTLEAMSDTIKSIDRQSFPRNLNACNWMYGKPCPFKKKCWSNK